MECRVSVCQRAACPTTVNKDDDDDDNDDNDDDTHFQQRTPWSTTKSNSSLLVNVATPCRLK